MYGATPLTTFIVPDPVEFVHDACAVTLVTVGLGDTFSIIYFIVGP